MTRGLWPPVPETLAVVDAPAEPAELAAAKRIRGKFLPPDWPVPYLNNVVRCFRLAAGKKRYMEVGTRDKGHIAWVSTILAPDAVIVDVDFSRHLDCEEEVAKFYGPQQTAIRVDAAPDDPATVDLVRARAQLMEYDIVFANSALHYRGALLEIESYFDFVKPGGFLITNDAYWEGEAELKGKCQALAVIDAIIPVYCVHMDEPVHRFRPREPVGGEWGTLAIIQKPAA